LEDVADFFRTYYTPDNAVLSIVGDVSVGEARRLVEEHFAAIPRGSGRPPLADMSLLARFGEWRREVVADEVMVPRLFLAMRSPVLGSEEYFAASVAGAVLGMSRGSRLYRRLVREQRLATEVAAFTFDLAKGSDLLIVDATARPEVAGEVLEAAVGECLDEVHANGVTADEVSRAVALITTDLVTSLQSAQSRADKLSQFATYFGDPALVNIQVERFERVTVDEVNRFARERMGRDNRASLLYVPKVHTEDGGTMVPAGTGEEG
ncbi:MAG: M16 family metallopeptidase, partial [Gemmatimonadota bacterium]